MLIKLFNLSSLVTALGNLNIFRVYNLQAQKYPAR